MNTYSSLENALVAPVSGGGLLDLGFGCIGVDNAVLSSNLFLVPLSVGLLLALILF